jgi:hypothetical protein
MFPFGHVGIGTHLIPRAVRERLPWRWLALGCLLPDLLDKPIWLTAQWLGVELPQLESARLFGHTAWFAGVLALAAALAPKAPLRAIAYAVPTHLVLDVLTDYGLGGHGVWRTWLFWPLGVPSYAIVSIPPLLRAFTPEASSAVYVAGEVLGAALLIWDRAHDPTKSH